MTIPADTVSNSLQDDPAQGGSDGHAQARRIPRNGPEARGCRIDGYDASAWTAPTRACRRSLLSGPRMIRVAQTPVATARFLPQIPWPRARKIPIGAALAHAAGSGACRAAASIARLRRRKNSAASVTAAVARPGAPRECRTCRTSRPRGAVPRQAGQCARAMRTTAFGDRPHRPSGARARAQSPPQRPCRRGQAHHEEPLQQDFFIFNALRHTAAVDCRGRSN